MKKYTKPYPTVGEIIKNKNYDYVSYRCYLANRCYLTKEQSSTKNEDTLFLGCFKVVDGEIDAMDDGVYNKDMPVLASEEWSNPECGIHKGLTIIVEI